jgi:hypothetical protein
MLDNSVAILRVVALAQQWLSEWSGKWFWRRRLPGFLDTRTAVRDRIRQRLTKGESSELRCFGLLSGSQPISLDTVVLQVMALHEMGHDFDFEVIFHPRETEWISDGGKRDSWEKFEDCHTEVEKAPAWYEVRLAAAVEAPVVQ